MGEYIISMSKQKFLCVEDALKREGKRLRVGLIKLRQ